MFETPASIPKLPFEPPSDIPIHEFLFGDDSKKYGRYSPEASKPPFICGVTGKSYSVSEVAQRFDSLARALAVELGWQSSAGVKDMERTIAVYALNTIDTLTVSWAAHRLLGAACPISPTYTPNEVANQLKAIKCKALFTSAPLIENALEAAAAAGIPRAHVYVLEVPDKATKGMKSPEDLKTVNQVINEGLSLDPLPALDWADGQGAQRTAFLCSSSGTSGMPKSVRLTHRNVIANILQFVTFETEGREVTPELSLGVLPLSHAFALIATAQMSVYSGHGVVILPNIDIFDMLRSIQEYKISRLWMIPPLVVALINAPLVVKTFDLSSVRSVLVGAASLSKETLTRFETMLPGCQFIQGYGMTEVTCIASVTSRDDIMFGSCGHLLPGIQGRLIGADGQDIDDHDQPGELLLRGPNLTPGYFGNTQEQNDAFTIDGWLRSGDLVELRKSEKGRSHIFIVDRLKELIKVNGMQVAPAELEAFLLQHPMIGEVSVVPAPDEYAGELPRAYVVRSAEAKEKDNEVLRKSIHAYIDESFPQHKRLAGGIDFLEALPKTPSGKVQRSALKEKAKASVKAKETALKNIADEKSLEQGIQVYTIDSDEEDVEG